MKRCGLHIPPMVSPPSASGMACRPGFVCSSAHAAEHCLATVGIPRLKPCGDLSSKLLSVNPHAGLPCRSCHPSRLCGCKSAGGPSCWTAPCWADSHSKRPWREAPPIHCCSLRAAHSPPAPQAVHIQQGGHWVWGQASWRFLQHQAFIPAPLQRRPWGGRSCLAEPSLLVPRATHRQAPAHACCMGCLANVRSIACAGYWMHLGCARQCTLHCACLASSGLPCFT